MPVKMLRLFNLSYVANTIIKLCNYMFVGTSMMPTDFLLNRTQLFNCFDEFVAQCNEANFCEENTLPLIFPSFY